MISFLRHLSAPAEFCLVLFLGFGVQIHSAVRAIVGQRKRPAPGQVQLSNADVLRTVAVELVSLGATLWFGSIRGWSLATFGLHISWKGTAAGVLLFAGLLVAGTLLSSALNLFHPRKAITRFVGMTLPFAVLLSVVNPIFEETIESGYFIHALQHFGMWPAVLASAVITCFLHAYLGIDAVADVLLPRVIFGLVYWRWRQLWPIVLAHSLLDFLALAAA